MRLAERGIALVVIMLPSGDAFDDRPGGPAEHLSTALESIAARLKLPRLDATELLRESLNRGENPIQPDRTHFNEEGHRLVAQWLHEHLPEVAPLKNAGQDPAPVEWPNPVIIPRILLGPSYPDDEQSGTNLMPAETGLQPTLKR